MTAPNVKPSVTLGQSPAIGAVGVTASTYLYAQGITEHEVQAPSDLVYDPEAGDYLDRVEVYTDSYSKDFTLPIFKDGNYTYGFFDKYGGYYEFPINIAGLPNDPVVLISESEVTKDPVTITATSTSGGAFTVDTDALPEGTTVTGNKTGSLQIVLSESQAA